MEELEGLRQVAWTLISRYDNTAEASEYIESCDEEWRLYGIIRGASERLPMEKIQRWQKVSSNQRESEILSEINMARRLRSDNRIVRKEIEGYKSFAEGKGQIIELLRKEAEDSAAQLETLKTRCEELETECQ